MSGVIAIMLGISTLLGAAALFGKAPVPCPTAHRSQGRDLLDSGSRYDCQSREQSGDDTAVPGDGSARQALQHRVHGIRLLPHRRSSRLYRQCGAGDDDPDACRENGRRDCRRASCCHSRTADSGKSIEKSPEFHYGVREIFLTVWIFKTGAFAAGMPERIA